MMVKVYWTIFGAVKGILLAGMGPLFASAKSREKTYEEMGWVK